MIRTFDDSDVLFLKKVHEQYYKEEFVFPDFFNKFLSTFTVIEDDKIVTTGGIQTILEAVAITDKSLPTKTRVRALIQLLEATKWGAQNHGYTQIHTTVIEDWNWEKILMKVGFKPVRGKVMVLEI